MLLSLSERRLAVSLSKKGVLYMAKKAARVATVVTPKDLSEVNSLLGEIGHIDRALAREKIRLEAAFDRLRKESAERLMEAVVRRTDAVKAIGRFARKNREKILPEDRKSLELSAGTIGWRFDPWKVVLGSEENSILTWLQTHRVERFIRRKVELNREQLLTEKPEDIPGIRFEQKERFFVEPKTEAVPEAVHSIVSIVRVA